MTFPSISAGETIMFAFDGAIVAPNTSTGTITFTIQADALGQVSERDFDNNFANFLMGVYDPTVSMGCGGGPVPATALPDARSQIGVGPAAGSAK